MSKHTPIYTDFYFSEQLKKFRNYKGYKTQAILCKKLNISRQVWSLWELNKRKPTLPQLIDISNFLEVDMRYFFIGGAKPEDYDLTIETTAVNQKTEIPENEINLLLRMPFTETIASKQLFKTIDQCRIRKGVYTITVYTDSGTTRSIREYYHQNPGTIKIIEEFQSVNDIRNASLKTEALIFDDADKIPEDLLETTITNISREISGSIILIGKKIKVICIQKKLPDHIDEHFTIDCITTNDFGKIIKAALPDASENVLNFLRIETGMRLKKLAEIIRLIEEEKKGKIKFILTINSLIKLCNQI